MKRAMIKITEIVEDNCFGEFHVTDKKQMMHT